MALNEGSNGSIVIYLMRCIVCELYLNEAVKIFKTDVAVRRDDTVFENKAPG